MWQQGFGLSCHFSIFIGFRRFSWFGVSPITVTASDILQSELFQSSYEFPRPRLYNFEQQNSLSLSLSPRFKQRSQVPEKNKQRLEKKPTGKISNWAA